MPIYEYTCQKCKAHIEIIQKVTDKPLARHGKCGGKLEKEWSKTGFQFKGTGWYVTDYAGKKTDAKDAKEEPKEKKNDAAADKTSEAKPAAEAKTTPEAAAKPKPTSSTPGKAPGGD